MKRILLLVLSLSMVGCGTTRKNQSSQSLEIVESAEAATTEITQKTEDVVVSVSETNEGEKVTTEVLEYDTSLPVDPETGTPPLKRKTIQTQERQTNIHQEQKAESQTDTTIQQQEESTTISESRTHDEVQTKRGLNFWQSGLICVGIFTLIAILLKLIFKRIKTK